MHGRLLSEGNRDLWRKVPHRLVAGADGGTQESSSRRPRVADSNAIGKTKNGALAGAPFFVSVM
jgi:hypothetical protein